jgi:2-dehydropantoate 2-reductase
LSGPRIRILGTGALASLVGARLARAGVRVLLVGSWREGLEAISRRGIQVEEDGSSWSTPVRAAPLIWTPEEADVVLVLVKSPQTREVAPFAARALGPGGFVVTLQNGLGNAAILATHAREVVQGVTTLGATLLAPGRIRAEKGSLLLAPSRGSEALAATLREAAFDAQVSPEIDTAVWRKLAVNCAINPLSAVLGLPNGALLDSPSAREQLFEAAREVGRVAEARGTPLGTDAASLAEEAARRTSGNRSSMLQDMDRRAPTEIDALNGALVREGERLHIPTPVNVALMRAVRARETALGRRESAPA